MYETFGYPIALTWFALGKSGAVAHYSAAARPGPEPWPACP